MWELRCSFILLVPPAWPASAKVTNGFTCNSRLLRLKRYHLRKYKSSQKEMSKFHALSHHTMNAMWELNYCQMSTMVVVIFLQLLVVMFYLWGQREDERLFASMKKISCCVILQSDRTLNILIKWVFRLIEFIMFMKYCESELENWPIATSTQCFHS